MVIEEKIRLQELLKQLFVLLSDANDVEKIASRIQNESRDLLEKLNTKFEELS